MANLVIGALNIAATPHPEEVYRRALMAAAGREVQVWGSDYAKITKPTELDGKEGVLSGRINVWTEIDRRGRWFDSRKEDEAEASEKKKISIPDHLNPNYRSFRYAFLEKRHRLILEYRNEDGEGFGPQRASKLFSTLLSIQVLGPDWPEFNVTIIPNEDAVSKILDMAGLRKLIIHIERPNSDDLNADKVLERLKKLGAKSEETALTKAAGEPSLKPDAETRKLAEIASENGYVTGQGRDADGKPALESTKHHPKKETVSEHESPNVRFNASLGLF